MSLECLWTVFDMSCLNENGETCSIHVSRPTNFTFEENKNRVTCSAPVSCPTRFMLDENENGETCSIHVSCPTKLMLDENENGENCSSVSLGSSRHLSVYFSRYTFM